MGQRKLSEGSGGLPPSTLTFQIPGWKKQTLRTRSRQTRVKNKDQTFSIVSSVTWEATKTESRAGGKDLSFKEQWLREIVVFRAFHFCSSVADFNYLSFKTNVFKAVPVSKVFDTQCPFIPTGGEKCRQLLLSALAYCAFCLT